MNGMTASDSTRDSVRRKPLVSHIDFWPSCQLKADRACDATFESFNVLVDRANRWIQQFTDFALINCETVDKKVITVRDIYSASQTYVDDEGCLAVHVKGLRLWYENRTPESPPPGAIGFMDVLPRYLNPNEKHPKFESLPETVDRINNRLRDYPVQGPIISVETVMLKIPEEDWSPNVQLNCRQCSMIDEYNTHQVFFVRIYYVIGTPTYEYIGVEDFTPDEIVEGGIFQPAQYTPLTTLLERARHWIDGQNIRVTNIQTLDCKHRKKSENHGMRFNTARMFEYKIEERFRAYFLRVGYVQPRDPGMMSWKPRVPHAHCRTFLPLRTQTGYENITEMLGRLDVVFRALEAKGIPVFQVETVPIPEWITKEDTADHVAERTFFDGEWYFVPDKDGNDRGPYRYTILYALRVYFDGHLVETPMQVEKSGGCCLIS